MELNLYGEALGVTNLKSTGVWDSIISSASSVETYGKDLLTPCNNGELRHKLICKASVL